MVALTGLAERLTLRRDGPAPLIAALPPRGATEPAFSRPRTALWILAGALMGLSLAFEPLAPSASPSASEFPLPPVILAAAFIAVGAVGRLDLRRLGLMAALVVAGLRGALASVHRPGVAGAAGPGFWLQVAGPVARRLAHGRCAWPRVELLDPARQQRLARPRRGRGLRRLSSCSCGRSPPSASACRAC